LAAALSPNLSRAKAKWQVAPVAAERMALEDYRTCLANAEAAERLAARSYNAVDYAEHLAAARLWRQRAAECAPGVTAASSPDAGNPSPAAPREPG
jgi:hypothetical protein